MIRRRSSGGTDWDALFALGGVVLAAVYLFGALLAASAGVSGVLAGGGWRWTPMDAWPGVVGDLADNPLRPSAAFPAPVAAAVPGPVPFHVVLTLLSALLLGVLVFGSARWLRWRNGRGSRSRHVQRESSALWASAAQVPQLRVDGPEPGRLMLGRLGKQLVATPQSTSLLVVAPTRTGKTTRFVIPAALQWTGAMLVTSVKPDVLRTTIAERRRRGQVAVFDPTGATGYESARWSPLLTCGVYAEAEKTASWLADASKAETLGVEHAQYWETLGVRLLAPLLFAAARMQADMTQVSRWVDYQAEAAVMDILEELDDDDALASWAATCAREPRSKPSVFGTAEVILKAFASPTIRAATSVRGGDPEALDVETLLVAGGTLYVVAPEDDQELFRPVFESLVNSVLRAAQRRHAASGQPLDPPLLLLLDEAANVAPIRKLDKLAASGAGQGITVCSVWQDEGQIEALYGRRARTVTTNHTTRVYLPGSSDLETLERLSRLMGEDEARRRSKSTGSDGSQSHSESQHDVRLAQVEYLRQLSPDTAIALSGRLPPLRLLTTPWFEDSTLCGLAPRPLRDWQRQRDSQNRHLVPGQKQQ